MYEPLCHDLVVKALHKSKALIKHPDQWASTILNSACVDSNFDMWASDEQFARDLEDKSIYIGWDEADSMFVILNH